LYNVATVGLSKNTNSFKSDKGDEGEIVCMLPMANSASEMRGSPLGGNDGDIKRLSFLEDLIDPENVSGAWLL